MAAKFTWHCSVALVILFSLCGRVRSDQTFTCQPSEFTCKNRQCIKLSFKCDEIDDCGDNSDEQGCPVPTCSPSEFTCANRFCISASFRCNNDDDCLDNSDEIGCDAIAKNDTCGTNEFHCDNGNCISLDFKCDFWDNCGDNSDEHACVNKTCSDTEIKCKHSGRCVPARYRCDGRPDCMDSSDEQDCPTFSPGPTTPSPILRCRKTEFMCKDRKKCLHRSWICDGSKDCDDGSDELPCGTVGCSKNEFNCSNRRCVPQFQRCDGNNDCGDNSDEKSCPTPGPVCKVGQARCGSSNTCIDESKVCNLVPDCPHGEDERRCNKNECLDNNAHCGQLCNDTKNSYFCSCLPGYELKADRRSCADIDECKIPGMCSQKCVNTIGSFKCSCAAGYILEGDGRRCRASGPKPKVMFTNRRSIRYVMADRADYDVAIKELQDARAMDFDFQNSMVYWTDATKPRGPQTIRRANIDKNPVKIETVISEGLAQPDGIAVDWVGRKIYWTDIGKNAIKVAELDGTNAMTLLSNGIDKPRAIVVDPAEGYVYWTDWGDPAKIERASMDGSNRKVLVSGKDIEFPNGLAIDYTNRKLYWVDAKLDLIKHCGLDGSNARELINEGIRNPFSITVFEDHIYWTDLDKQGKLLKANKFTGKDRRVLVRDFHPPLDAHVYQRERQPRASNPCATNNGGCSHLCLISANTNKKFSCKCPDDFFIQYDGKSCGKSKQSSASPSQPTSGIDNGQSTVNPNVNLSARGTGTRSKSNLALILGLVFGIGVVFILVVVVVVLVIKKRREPKLEILYHAESETAISKEDNLKFDNESYAEDERGGQEEQLIANGDIV